MVITDASQREALASLYRKAISPRMAGYKDQVQVADASGKRTVRLVDSVLYLADHLHEVPVLVVDSGESTTDEL